MSKKITELLSVSWNFNRWSCSMRQKLQMALQPQRFKKIILHLDTRRQYNHNSCRNQNITIWWHHIFIPTTILTLSSMWKLRPKSIIVRLAESGFHNRLAGFMSPWTNPIWCIFSRPLQRISKNITNFQILQVSSTWWLFSKTCQMYPIHQKDLL